VRNVERDERVVLSIEGQGFNEHGLREYLVVHGRARVPLPPYVGDPGCRNPGSRSFLGPGDDLDVETMRGPGIKRR
jgi:hypothetical protein